MALIVIETMTFIAIGIIIYLPYEHVIWILAFSMDFMFNYYYYYAFSSSTLLFANALNCTKKSTGE